MTFRGWTQDALDFYEGLEADNSKAYFHAHKQVYDEQVKAPFLELSVEIQREFGPMHIIHVADCSDEILEVVTLGEAGKL